MSRYSLIFIFATAVLNSSTPAFSSPIPQGPRDGSEVMLFTPWNFIKTSVSKYVETNTFKDDQLLPAIDWQVGAWTPHLSSVQANLETGFSVTGFSPQDIDLQSRQLTIKLVVAKLDIDQVIRRTVNGLIMNVHVKGTCGPITMAQTSASIKGRLNYKILPQKVQTQVSLANLSWAPHSWRVTEVTCQGPSGFDQTVSAELTAALTDPDMIKPWLQNLLAVKLQGEADSLLTQLVRPVAVPAHGSAPAFLMAFQTLENSPSGVLAHANLLWSKNPTSSNVFPLLNHDVPAKAAQGDLPVILTPTQGWSAFIEEQGHANDQNVAIDMLTIPVFRNLLSSPFEEDAVWPDLSNYQVNSRFQMRIKSSGAYHLEWNDDGTAKFQSPVTGVIRSIRAGRTWNYINLPGAINGRLNVRVTQGHLLAAVHVNKSDFSPVFDPSYIHAFNPDTKLDPKVVQGLESYIDKGFNYPSELPVIKLGTMTAVFDGWQGVSRDIVALPLRVTSH